jgi:hypothetical protein
LAELIKHQIDGPVGLPGVCYGEYVPQVGSKQRPLFQRSNSCPAHVQKQTEEDRTPGASDHGLGYPLPPFSASDRNRTGFFGLFKAELCEAGRTTISVINLT